ncbi:MAG: hypothetical protein ABI949_11210 [Ilumatobacteraceae bacterium]
MTYAFTQDVPINAEFYQQIVDKLGDEPAKGLITHLAIERPEGGLRYVDVWESEDDFDNFVETRLHPVVHELLHGIFGDDLPPEPERTMISVIHCWQP